MSSSKPPSYPTHFYFYVLYSSFIHSIPTHIITICHYFINDIHPTSQNSQSTSSNISPRFFHHHCVPPFIICAWFWNYAIPYTIPLSYTINIVLIAPSIPAPNIHFITPSHIFAQTWQSWLCSHPTTISILHMREYSTLHLIYLQNNQTTEMLSSYNFPPPFTCHCTNFAHLFNNYISPSSIQYHIHDNITHPPCNISFHPFHSSINQWIYPYFPPLYLYYQSFTLQLHVPHQVPV